LKSAKFLLKKYETYNLVFRSENYQDELTFAAAFLAFATGEQVYKTAAANFWTKFGLGWVQPYFDWGSKNAGIAVSTAFNKPF